MAHVDKRLTLSFGAVVLGLLGIFLLVASILSFGIQERRQEFLASSLARVVEQSVNRVNFYQMRTLVGDLVATVPGLGYLAVTDQDCQILAHNDESLVGKTLAEVGMVSGDTSNFVQGKDSYLQVDRPLLGGLRPEVVGHILVGISVTDLRRDQAWFLGTLTLLSLAGTALAMVAVIFLGRRFEDRTRTLALQLQGFLDRSPVGLAVVDREGAFLQRSRSFSVLAPEGAARFPDALARRLAPGAAVALTAQAAQVRRDGVEAKSDWSLGDETWNLVLFPLGMGQTGVIAQDLTQRVKAEGELVASRAQLNQIIDLSPVGILIGDVQTRRMVRLNRRFTETYGYTMDTSSTLGQWIEAAFPDPDDRQGVLREWATSSEAYRKSGTTMPTVELEMMAADGSLRTVMVSTALVGTLALLTFVDRTEQKHAEKALSELNRSLEEKVRLRTEELERTYRELADTDKFAALGQLAAGMAHELNTPLGAIQAANRTMVEFLQAPLRNLIAIGGDWTPAERDLLLRLIDQNATLAATIPASPNRSARRKLVAAMGARGLVGAEETAEYLLELGWTEADLDPFVGRPQSWQTVLTGLDLLTLVRMAYIVGEGTDKAAHVVDALRQYIRGKDDVEFARFVVSDQLETVLTLVQHKFKGTVEVVRQFEPDVSVVGDRQRLNQVWMNVIHNALQAMEYRGTLRLTVARQGNTVAVSVGDSGPGIPEAIRDKIFTPYFTTKKRGDGMGLGLDLCRKIVKSHHGSMSFESEPGKTVFTVTLPAS